MAWACSQQRWCPSSRPGNAVTDLHLSILARVCLLKADIQTVDRLVKRSADDLLYRLDFDPYELYEIVCRLNERGFNLRAYRRRLPNDRGPRNATAAHH